MFESVKKENCEVENLVVHLNSHLSSDGGESHLMDEEFLLETVIHGLSEITVGVKK